MQGSVLVSGGRIEWERGDVGREGGFTGGGQIAKKGR